MFSHFFINRPIFAAVLSIVITLAGAVAVVHLPVAQYPQITPPSIIVTCNYPGADARVVAESVAALRGRRTERCSSDTSTALRISTPEARAARSAFRGLKRARSS